MRYEITITPFGNVEKIEVHDNVTKNTYYGMIKDGGIEACTFMSLYHIKEAVATTPSLSYLNKESIQPKE